MSSEHAAILMFVGLISVILLGTPLAFALGGLALIFGIIWWGTPVFNQFIIRIYGIMFNEVLVAVPLFILMGCLLERSGATEKLYGAMHRLMGPVRGGLALATVLICTLFAAATGIVGASLATMGLIALPAMLKRGYNKGLASGAVASGATLGILIPPSIMLVLYGPMAQVSVARLFAGAYGPGLLLSALYLVYIYVRCLLQPSAGPAISNEEREAGPSNLLLQLLIHLIPTLFLIIVVIGSILGGLASPTEASALGAFGAVILTLFYRKLNWQTLKTSVYSTLKITSMVLFVAIGASLFTGVFFGLGGGILMKEVLIGLPFGKWFVFSVMMFVIFILGMFIDWIGILFIVIPTFTPIGAVLGFDPIWFATMICVNLQMSFLTPPFAPSIFVLRGVAPPEVGTGEMIKGIYPFVGLQIIGLALCALFPEIILWLPRVTFG
jgi:tripartite ATP-independent transporter DctM subunit